MAFHKLALQVAWKYRQPVTGWRKKNLLFFIVLLTDSTPTVQSIRVVFVCSDNLEINVLVTGNAWFYWVLGMWCCKHVTNTGLLVTPHHPHKFQLRNLTASSWIASIGPCAYVSWGYILSRRSVSFIKKGIISTSPRNPITKHNIDFKYSFRILAYSFFSS